MTMMNDVILMDGAMGTELRRRGANVRDYKSSLWSAMTLLEAADMIREIHLDYIHAGARVITTNNYAVTRKLLAREKAEDQFSTLTRIAAELASKARDQAGASGQDVLIAGSLPPLDTTYRADLVGSFEDNVAAYEEMASLLAPYVDIFLCETLTTPEEARAAASAAIATGRDTWVSWTLAAQGDCLRGGADVDAAVQALTDMSVKAMLFNCCAVTPVNRMMPTLAGLTELPVGAYCNPVMDEPAGGEPESTIEKPMSKEEYADAAEGWARAGAKIIGGCCDTTPDYIAAIRDKLG